MAPHAPLLPDAVLQAVRGALPGVAAQTIAAVEQEVPGYRDTLDESARGTLSGAVEFALGGFLALAAEAGDPSAPLAPVLEGAYALGRGEARAGRTMDALLAAYRVGARVAWRGLASVAAQAGLTASELVAFAELVFAYIDQLSASSVAGHADELAVEGRARVRQLERLGQGLVVGASPETLDAAAAAAHWAAPEQLRAVLLPEAAVDHVLARVDVRTLQPVEDVPGLPAGTAVLLVPEPEPRLARALQPSGGILGPARPWRAARESYLRALRAQQLRLGQPGAVLDTEALLPELVIGADPHALADLRAHALAPLAGLRPGAADRLAETLHAWLLHRGRREEVAAALYVHPQTVRYRMGQVRALFGARLDDPREVLALTIALALPAPAADT